MDFCTGLKLGCEFGWHKVSSCLPCGSVSNSVDNQPTPVRGFLSSNAMFGAEVVTFCIASSVSAISAVSTYMPLNGTVLNPENFGFETIPMEITTGIASLSGILLLTNIGIRYTNRFSETSNEEEQLFSDESGVSAALFSDSGDSGFYSPLNSGTEVTSFSFSPSDFRVEMNRRSQEPKSEQPYVKRIARNVIGDGSFGR